MIFYSFNPDPTKLESKLLEKVDMNARVSFCGCNWLNADVPATFEAASQLTGRFLTTDLQGSVVKNGGNVGGGYLQRLR
jgi:hypothetical protein